MPHPFSTGKLLEAAAPTGTIWERAPRIIEVARRHDVAPERLVNAIRRAVRALVAQRAQEVEEEGDAMLAACIAEIQDIKCYMGALIPPPLPEFQNFPESGTKHFWEIYFLLIFPRSRVNERRSNGFSTMLAKRVVAQPRDTDCDLDPGAMPAVQNTEDVVLHQRLTAEQMHELREAQIDAVYEHPELNSYVWGSSAVTVPAGCEQAKLGVVPCLVFGRKPSAPLGVPTDLLFNRNSDLNCKSFEEVALAYVEDLSAQVIVLFCLTKLSECLSSARAVVAALPITFGLGQVLLVHGANTGSILARQVANIWKAIPHTQDTRHDTQYTSDIPQHRTH